MKKIVKDMDYFSNVKDLIFEKYNPEKMKIIDLKETFVDFKFNDDSKDSKNSKLGSESFGYKIHY